MADPRLARKLEEGLSQLPILDVHTHLVGGRLGARGLHDIILYHMAVSDLYSAGCPSGARLSQYPDFPSIEEAHSRIREALPYLHHTRNTSTSWGARIILRDLYGVTEPIGPDNWERVDSLIGERSEDRAWHREIIGRAGIARLGTELARRERGQDDDVLQYSLEWAFFTRCQWGEFDTALYELERCWGKTAGPPAPIGAEERLPAERAISSLDDVHAAVEWYVDAIPADRILALATHISTDIDLGPVGDAEMAAALAARASAGPKERSIYASYVNEAFLNSLEAKYGNRLVLQFSLGAEPLPFETGSRLSQGSIAQLAEMIGRHPGLQFQCFLAARHANQALCTLCRELPNLSLAGYWWHNFFPSVMRQVMEERLDMLPANRQIGFFSDAYCVEWAYAKAVIARRELAIVLTGKVERGQYSAATAVDIARQILFETPQALLGMSPHTAPG